MKAWLVGVAGVACGVAVAGPGVVFDVSSGSHEIMAGDVYDYAVARGDAVVTISGGEIVSSAEFMVFPSEGGGSEDAFEASVVGDGAAQLVIDGGVISGAVFAIGMSDVWIGPGASAGEYRADEHGTLTIQGTPEGSGEGVFVRASGRSRVFVRDGDFEGLEADDATVFVSGGAFETAGVSGYGELEVTGGTFSGGLVVEEFGTLRVVDGRQSSMVSARDESVLEISGGSVRRAVSVTTEPMRMSGGEVREGVNAWILEMTGGDIGLRALVEQYARLTVRSIAYDHDNNPGTPAQMLGFDHTGVLRIEEDDPRLIAGTLRGATIVWADGSETSFDLALSTISEADSYFEFVRATQPEDLNQDGGVDVLDLSIFLGAFGTDNAAADFNDDGGVDVLDLTRFLQAWGT